MGINPIILSTLRSLIEDAKLRNKKNTTGAIITFRREVIALATNDVTKTHPLQSRFARIPGETIYLHAEIAAIAKALRNRDLKILNGSTLYVARLCANGTWGNAKPCVGCVRAIDAFGIKEIIHT